MFRGTSTQTDQITDSSPVQYDASFTLTLTDIINVALLCRLCCASCPSIRLFCLYYRLTMPIPCNASQGNTRQTVSGRSLAVVNAAGEDCTPYVYRSSATAYRLTLTGVFRSYSACCHQFTQSQHGHLLTDAHCGPLRHTPGI